LQLWAPPHQNLPHFRRREDLDLRNGFLPLAHPFKQIRFFREPSVRLTEPEEGLEGPAMIVEARALNCRRS